jgi:hypothetical protein
LIPLFSRRWACPNCPVTTVTHDAAIPFHPCQGLRGITAPLVRSGVRAKVYTREREDYIGKEKVQMHNGRPVMSIVTERDNGSDLVIFAPTAAGVGSND